MAAEDSCAIGLAAKASGPMVAQDMLFSVGVSFLFISRFGVATKAMRKMAASNRQCTEKAVRKNYKYQYTMFKLCALFVVESTMMITAIAIGSITDMAAAMAAMMAVVTNLLLLFNFEFNDHHFRRVFCLCLRLQTLCIGLYPFTLTLSLSLSCSLRLLNHQVM